MPDSVSKLEEELVDVTPAPVFPWLEGLNDGMIGRVEVPGGVLVLRIVTAADMTTDETDTQMHPGIPYFQTILTAIGAWRDFTYLVKMTTGLCHVFLLSFLYENGSGRESHFSLRGLRVAFPTSSGRHTPCRSVLFE